MFESLVNNNNSNIHNNDNELERAGPGHWTCNHILGVTVQQLQPAGPPDAVQRGKIREWAFVVYEDGGGHHEGRCDQG